MTKLPYFITEHDFQDKTLQYRQLMLEIYDVIGDLIYSLKDQFGHYRYVLLFENFEKVKSTPRIDNAQNLPIANYEPMNTWDKILRACYEAIERAILKESKLKSISNAYRITFDKLQENQKVEYLFNTRIIANEGVKTEANLLNRLQLYHDIYEGEYKALISFYHLILDILENNFTSASLIENYFTCYPSKNLCEIKELSKQIKLQNSIDWILIGANNNIRNAIAHKNWKFLNNEVTLWNMRGNSKNWEKTFNIIEIEDIMKNLKLAVLGMQIGFLLPFIKYEEIIIKNQDRIKNDISTIHNFFYSAVMDYRFILDDIKIINAYELEFILIDNPVNEIPEGELEKGDLKLYFKKKRLPKLKERAIILALASTQNLWGYKVAKYIIKTRNDINLGCVKVNIERLFQLQDANIIDKEELEKCYEINLLEIKKDGYF